MIIDAVQLLICVCLVWHYTDQRKQVEQRTKILWRVEMQSEVKLHHPLFGNKQQTYFALMCMLQLLDTFMIPNLIQLFILVLTLILILFWEPIVNKNHWSLLVLTRISELVCIV